MPKSLYERVGGRPFFEDLSRRFYRAVAEDPVLRSVYPSDPAALEAARANLALFLVQFWGGPDDYNRTRGHPRLKMRHAPFAIGPAERDAWVSHMSDVVRASGLASLDEMQMLRYFSAAADQMVNSD